MLQFFNIFFPENQILSLPMFKANTTIDVKLAVNQHKIVVIMISENLNVIYLLIFIRKTKLTTP